MTLPALLPELDRWRLVSTRDGIVRLTAGSGPVVVAVYVDGVVWEARGQTWREASQIVGGRRA
jgi:hypothetical protein